MQFKFFFDFNLEAAQTNSKILNQSNQLNAKHTSPAQ